MAAIGAPRFAAGVDETGRGSCVGRLYVAAAVVNPDDVDPSLITDSKKLKGRKLAKAYEHAKEIALDYVVGWAEREEVDRDNPTHATISAWHRCLDGLDPELFDRVVVDGTQFRPYKVPHECVPKADALHPCVSVASILAKVERDQYIQDLVAAHPELREYGIHTNMGYPSPKHREAVRRLGKTPFHRDSYKMT